MSNEVSLVATVAIGFALAFPFGLIAHQLRLPPLVGYLIAGVAMGALGTALAFQGDFHWQEVGRDLVMQGMFAAFDAICTHMNCTVAYNALNFELDCPCHGSTYDVMDGRVLGGPAPLPLTKLAASSDGTTVTVTLP